MLRRALAQLDKGDVLTVTRLDHRRKKQPRRTSDSQINKKRPPALPQAAQVREETPKEGVGATILLHRNNIAQRGVRISRTTLSDRTSRLRPRLVVPKPCQTYEPEVLIEMREWIGPAAHNKQVMLT